jgi:hypothetical protein
MGADEDADAKFYELTGSGLGWLLPCTTNVGLAHHVYFIIILAISTLVLGSC